MRNSLPTISLAVAMSLVVAVTSTSASAAVNDCDRTCLRKMADLYFDALAQHQPSLLPLSAQVKFTETGRILKLGEGLWKHAGKPTYRCDLLDPQSGGIGVEAVVPENGVPTIVALRLKVENHLITEVESIVIRPSDKAALTIQGFAVYAPELLVAPSKYFTRKLRPAEQNSRYELTAAADGYFRAFETEGTPDYIKVAALPDTLRFENGVQAANVETSAVGNIPTVSAQFDLAMFKGAKVTDRRYPVVDTEIGAVMSLVRFGDGEAEPPRPKDGSEPRGAAYVSEIFAVTQGKIVEIQAVWVPSLGRLPTPW
jgi:hypothetical protein